MAVLSPERLGIITASRMEAVLAFSAAYIQQLIAERSGVVMPATGDEEVGGAREWGRRYEPAALAAYELRRGVDVEPGRFCRGADLDYVGGTPDGFVGHDGLVEAKCPADPSNHAETRTLRRVPPRYIAQTQAELWVTGRAWLDFVSFDPRQPPGMDLVVIRVLPDAALRARMRTMCERVWECVTTGRIPKTIDVLPSLF